MRLWLAILACLSLSCFDNPTNGDPSTSWCNERTHEVSVGETLEALTPTIRCPLAIDPIARNRRITIDIRFMSPQRAFELVISKAHLQCRVVDGVAIVTPLSFPARTVKLDDQRADKLPIPLEHVPSDKMAELLCSNWTWPDMKVSSNTELNCISLGGSLGLDTWWQVRTYILFVDEWFSTHNTWPPQPTCKNGR